MAERVTYRPFKIGDRVVNTRTCTAVPVGSVGTVVDGPMCSYGVTVSWDNTRLVGAYGPDGWRPYWSTRDLTHAEVSA